MGVLCNINPYSIFIFRWKWSVIADRITYRCNSNSVECEGKSIRTIADDHFQSAVLTAVFYLILKHFHTANIVPSTLSVTTSFLAVYLTFRRSPYFSLAYAANDIVLIVLWTFASYYDKKYIAVMVCFIAFLINDIYAFVSWQKMKIKQSNIGKATQIFEIEIEHLSGKEVQER